MPRSRGRRMDPLAQHGCLYLGCCLAEWGEQLKRWVMAKLSAVDFFFGGSGSHTFYALGPQIIGLFSGFLLEILLFSKQTAKMEDKRVLRTYSTSSTA